jgi:hypothetical protein
MLLAALLYAVVWVVQVVGAFKSTERATRHFCKVCGCGVFTDAGAMSIVSPALFSEGDTFRVPKELGNSLITHSPFACGLC